MLTHFNLEHFHRPLYWYDDIVEMDLTGGVYTMRGAVPITCGDDRGTATALVYRFDVHDGKHGVGTLSIEMQEVPPALREALSRCDGALSMTFDIDGIVVPAGSLCAAWSVADSGPVSLTVGPVSKADVSALIVRQYKPVVA